MQATQSQRNDWIKTSLGWQERNLKIVNKEAKVVALHHNIAQLKVHNTKQLQREQGLPVRIIICKARQEGVSTGEAADIFEDINRFPNRQNCLISADLDATNKVFKMIKRFQDEIPSDVKRKPLHSNRKEIAYPSPHYSSILCQTAGKDVLGRGGTTHRVHGTEVSIWAQAEEKLFGLFQEIPVLPDTSVVLESTACGTSGEFHDMFWIAYDRIKRNPDDFNGFLPVFLPWWIFPDYKMTLPKTHKNKLELYTDHEAFGDEQRLVMRFGCTVEQLYWRRYKIVNEFKNNLSRFMQEYPATAREAFQGSGRMVFLPSKIDAMEKWCRPPKEYIEFFMDGDKVRWRPVLRRENCWSVWKWPVPEHDYICFGDVAQGRLSDPANPKSKSDRSISAILDRHDFDIPITYYGRPDTIEFGDQMFMAATFYSRAWASPEMNMGIGQSVLDKFKREHYPFVYVREHKEDTDNPEDMWNLGWCTTTKTRKPMIDDLVVVVNEGELKIYDQRFVDEFRCFVFDKTGKPQADVGRHDDCVLTVGGCIQLHHRCASNQDDYDVFNKEEMPRAKIAMMGQSGDDDHEIDEDDDDESSYQDDLSNYE